MFITTSYLKESFKKYNELYFDNELPMPDEFKVGRGVRRLGCFQTKGRFPFQKTAIMVSQYNGLRTQADIDHTLIHEMIHLWQWNNHYGDTHGKSFKKKAWDIHIKSKGVFNISATHRGVRLEATANASNLPEVASPKTINVFALYNKKLNVYMMVACANTCVRYYLNWFSNNPDLFTFFGWWETNDKDLLKLPRNQRGKKYRFMPYKTKNEFLLFAREKNLSFLVKNLEDNK